MSRSNQSSRQERALRTHRLRGRGLTWEDIAAVWETDCPEDGPRVAFRLAHNLSQDQVAEQWRRLSPGEPTMVRGRVFELERGSRRSSVANLQMLAQIYQCTGRRLLTADEYGGYSATERAEIDRIDFRHLDPNQQQSAGQQATREKEAPTTEGDAKDGWLDPLSIARDLQRLASSNIDPATIDALRQMVVHVIIRYEEEGPHALAPRTTALRRMVHTLLDGRQPPLLRLELYRLASQASGVLGYMAVNAGKVELAEAYCAEAIEMASSIEDLDLQAWVMGTRSLNAYYTGRYREAADIAAAGVELAPFSAQAIRLKINGEARALAKLGDRTGAERALSRALEISQRHHVPDGLTPCISFEPYSLARTLANAVTVYTSLRQVDRVHEYAEQIDDLIEQSRSTWSRILVGLDVATAELAAPQPDIDRAMTLGRHALTTNGGPPIRSVVQRAHELLSVASPWSSHREVRDYVDVLRNWRSDPQARALTELCSQTGLSPSKELRRAPGS